MKNLLALTIWFGSTLCLLNVSFAQRFIIEPGELPRKSDSSLYLRVMRLEQAVEELQEKVFVLQHDKKLGKDEVPPQRKWFCEITSFGDRFSSYGPTELEAKQAALKQCSDKFGNEFNCKKIVCQLNK